MPGHESVLSPGYIADIAQCATWHCIEALPTDAAYTSPLQSTKRSFNGEGENTSIYEDAIQSRLERSTTFVSPFLVLPQF